MSNYNNCTIDEKESQQMPMLLFSLLHLYMRDKCKEENYTEIYIH